MNIMEKFRELEKRGEGALIAYVTGGDPSPKYTSRIVEVLVKGGVDIVEIGIPFSDPIADGPTIQASDFRALKAGTTPKTVFNIVREIKNNFTEVPIVILTYYNIPFKMGLGYFMGQASKSGVDGVVVADLPVEEAGEYKDEAEKHGVDTVFLATPSTSTDRLRKILNMTSGFLYLVSVFGVTGVRESLAQLTIQTIRRIHSYTEGSIPLAVGFGISKPEHVGAVIACGAEGAIVGSAFIKVIERNLNFEDDLLRELSDLAYSFKSATKIKRTLP
ncbi:MAG: tryptophan synthase subunit alpha [Thermoproteota archaeon]